MPEVTIERLGLEFFSKLDPAFGKNVETAVKNFQDKIKPSIQQITNLFKGLGVTVSAFYKMVEQTPIINIAKSFDVSGISGKLVGTFKDARTKSVAEFEKLNSEISGQVTKLKAEFAKLERYISELRAGENPVVAWGKPTFSAKKGVYFPESRRAIEDKMMALAPEEEIQAERQAKITEYAQRQLQVYQQMVDLIGQMGAFEQARLATSELIAQRVQEETAARAKVAEFVGITKELLSRGLLAEGTDEKKLQSMKQYLDELIKTEEGRKVLNQELDVIMGKIVKDEQAIKDIILSSVGDKEKILAVTKQIADQYEKIKASSIGIAGGGTGGLGGGGADWDRLIGKIQLAGAVVSQFQQKLQTIQIKAFINPDEFTRLSSITQAINSEVADLTSKIAHLGSQSVARKMAEDWDVLRADIEKTGQAMKEAEALQKKGLPVTNVIDLDKAVYGLTARLKDLAVQGEAVQLKAVQAGLAKTNAEINRLTGGVEINRKSLKQLGFGYLELEKLQSLLTERMKLIRQEFGLTGKSTAAMNAQMEATAESLGIVQYQVGQFTKRSADANRAMDRWGVGFKDMLKSQMAWLLGGALIFGTVFKIQQAFSETIGTMFKFRQAMIDVGAITEASAEEMKIMERAARDVATSSKMSFMETADALKILGQAGLSATQSAQALRTVAMLVTATGASSQEAVKVLTTAMSVWNLSAKESTRVGNVLAAALNYSKLEINDLATAFNYVAAMASQVGMSIEETAGSIAVLSNAGIRASTIGTGLRGIMAQLIAPTKAFREEIKAVGLKFSDIQMPGHGLIEVLRTLQKAGFDLGNIFEGLEKRQAGALAAMLNMGSEAFREMTERLTGTNAMMVMFERSMEGPMNRLKVLGNQLLNMGIGLTDIVVPAFNGLISVLGKTFDSIKDTAPILALTAALLNMTHIVTGLTVAYKALGIALTFIAKHPIILVMGGIVAAWSLLKTYVLDTGKALQDTIKQQDKELSLLGRKILDIEKLNAMMKEGNITQEQMNEAIAETAATHMELNEAIRQGQLEGKELGKIFEEILKKFKKQFDDLKMIRFVGIATVLEQEQKRLEKMSVDWENLQRKAKEHPLEYANVLDATEKVNKAIDKQKKVVADADEAVRAAARGMRGYAEDTIREMMANAGLSQSLADVVVGYVDVFKTIEKGVSVRTKPTSDELKALNEWRMKSASEFKKLEIERKDALDEIGDTAKLEGEALAKAEERKFYINKFYDDKERDLREKHLNEKLALEKKFQGYFDDLYKIDLQNRLKEAKQESDELIRIDKVLAIERAEVWSNYFKQRDAIMTDKDLAKDTATRSRILAETFTQLTRTLADKEDQAEIEREKIREKRRLQRLESEREFREELLKIQTEIVNNEIAIARTEADRITGEEKAIDLAYQSAESKHTANLKKLEENRDKELRRAGLSEADYWAIIKKYHVLIEKEDERYWSERGKIFSQGVKTISDLLEKEENDRIKELQRNLDRELEMETRADKDRLKAKEAQYDTMSESERESEAGRKLKNDIDRLTVSITEKTIALYEDLIATERNTQGAHANIFAIAEWEEKILSLNEKLRRSRRDMTDYDTSQKSMLEGMAAGWKQYWDGVKVKFEDGRKVMQDWLNTVQSTLSTVFNDLLTGQLKSFKDYFRSFANAIARTWSDMLAKMVMNWVKSLANMSTSAGGGNWFSSLLGGLGGIIAGIFAGGVGTTNFGLGYTPLGGIIYHHGGVVKKHEGGLEQDEVIAKLLSNEYVLRREAAQNIGKERLDYMNITGQVPEKKESRPVEVVIYNILDPEDVVARGIAANENVIINPVVSSYNINGPMRRVIQTDR